MKIKELIKKLVRWAFNKRVKTYQNVTFISDLDISRSNRKDELISHYKRNLAIELVEKLILDNMLDFEEEKCNGLITGRRIRAKIRLIK